VAEPENDTEAQNSEELERVNRALSIAKSEARDFRKKIEAYEAAEQETLSETEKFQVEIKAISEAHKALKAELATERVRTAILGMARELGFASPEDAMALLDLSEVETTDGKVSGFEKSLEALAGSGRLAMSDQQRSDGLGTPQGKGMPASGVDKQEAPIVRF